jgi:hypothetical protein
MGERREMGLRDWEDRYCGKMVSSKRFFKEKTNYFKR